MKFPVLGIAVNVSTSVMAKVLFTAKVLRPMAGINLRDHETRRIAYPAGYTEKGVAGPCIKKTVGIATPTTDIRSDDLHP